MNALQERLYSPETNLASTVVAEHFHRASAELVLTDESFRGGPRPPGRQDIYVWHALEGIRAQGRRLRRTCAMGGSERNRIWSMKLTLGTCPDSHLIPVQVFVTDRPPAGLACCAEASADSGRRR